MAGKKWINFGGGAVLLVLAGTGLWVAVSEHTANPLRDLAAPENSLGGSVATGTIPTPSELADLQIKADAACLCGRARGAPWDAQCWADYHQSVGRFGQHGGWSTACADESTSTDCFGPEGPNQRCVTTQHMYGACSDAEERTRVAEARRRHESGCSG